ncbi:BON domain-containing protein [Rhizobium sp. P44RR-XXIV]|uniref:BON domain-containing protein n=1 Tax=Rhizobium sp. P44RR-XXIV TaxID=1921145 RepID=UPI000987D21D|nr:BON domain-containing protein [Rhizobium sp. P44RR-XXIV]TIX87995.1 BON domain-containing protein [Rhizobium sp. P44RR-XXIV]
MLFLAKLSSLTASSDSCATCAAIRCLIAYADGLEDSHIEVASVEGTIVLSGIASSDEARERALGIAGEYAGIRIINNIALSTDEGSSDQSEISV